MNSIDKELRKERLRKAIIYITLFVLCVFFLWYKPIVISLVSGESMAPTLHNGNIIILNKLPFKRNDVVSFKEPEDWDNSKRLFIKRIIGMPNDKITITKDKVFVNSKEVINFSGKLNNQKEDYTFTLASDEWFLVGDNIGRSNDSLYRYLNNENYIVKTKYLENRAEIDVKK